MPEAPHGIGIHRNDLLELVESRPHEDLGGVMVELSTNQGVDEHVH